MVEWGIAGAMLHEELDVTWQSINWFCTRWNQESLRISWGRSEVCGSKKIGQELLWRYLSGKYFSLGEMGCSQISSCAQQKGVCDQTQSANAHFCKGASLMLGPFFSNIYILYITTFVWIVGDRLCLSLAIFSFYFHYKQSNKSNKKKQKMEKFDKKLWLCPSARHMKICRSRSCLCLSLDGIEKLFLKSEFQRQLL